MKERQEHTFTIGTVGEQINDTAQTEPKYENTKGQNEQMSNKKNKKYTNHKWNIALIWLLLIATFALNYMVEQKVISYLVLGIVGVAFTVISIQNQKTANNAFAEAEEERERISMILNRVRKRTSVMQESANFAMEQIHQSEDIVQQINAIFEDMAKGNEIQTQSNHMIQETANTLFDKINHSSDRVKSLHVVGQMTNEKTIEGSEKIHSFETKMTLLSETINLAFGIMKDLKGKSEEMKRVFNSMQDFSNKASMLSLNATIQSAITGDQEKTFSIANEIKHLAEETGKATKEVSGLLNDVSHRTELASDKLKDGSMMVSEGMGVTSEVTEVFNSISSQADDLFFSIQSLENELDELISESQIVLECIDVVATTTEHQSVHAEEAIKKMEEQSKRIQSISEKHKEMKKSIQDLKTI